MIRFLAGTLLAGIAAWSASASATDVSLFGQGDMDTMYTWAVPREKFDAQLQWSPSAGSPPLPIGRAVEIADAWIKKQNPDVRQFVVTSVALARADSWGSGAAERWYYKVEFQPIVAGRRLFGGHFIAVVLFDGSVVEPSAEKRVPGK
jgi:hypothetical protein